MTNYLLIVEGEKTEKTILEEILKRYGFNPIKKDQKLSLDENVEDFNLDELSAEKSNVYIIQGPQNRISELLHKTNFNALNNKFNLRGEPFSGIFFIYDVDHTSNEDLEEFYNNYGDESSGMLLANSPCIEVLAENPYRQEELKVEHLKEYKKDLNKKFDKSHHCSAAKYIIDNFEKIAIAFINKNIQDTGSFNVMEHPKLIIDLINKHNIRQNNKPVQYRYFSTVIYTCIANMLGLTKQFDNANLVIDFFKNHIKNS